MPSKFVFGERRAVFFSPAEFLGLAFLACSVVAVRGFRTADFAADLFFFFDLAIVTVVAPFLIDWRGENGRLIKNVYPSTQADSPKKILLASQTRFSCNVQHPSGIYCQPWRIKFERRITGSPDADRPSAD